MQSDIHRHTLTKNHMESFAYGIAHLYNHRARVNKTPPLTRELFEKLHNTINQNLVGVTVLYTPFGFRQDSIALNVGAMAKLRHEIKAAINYKPNDRTLGRLLRHVLYKQLDRNKEAYMAFNVTIGTNYEKAKSKVDAKL